MFLTRSEYDRSVNTFSPEGRLFQVEYAIEAVKLGSTALGVKAKSSVVLVAEKRITSSLMLPHSVEKVVEVDKHVGLAFSGLTADANMLVEKARSEAQNHLFSYDSAMHVESIVQNVSNLAIHFGDSDSTGEGLSRPFGVALLFAGIDDADKGRSTAKPQLFHMDPSGTYVSYAAKAIGSGSEGAQQSLEESYHSEMEEEEAIKMALTILKQVMEERLSNTNVEVAVVDVQNGFRILTQQELQTHIQNIAN